MRSTGPISTAALLLVIGLVIGLGACGNAATRSTSKFCGELRAHANEIQTPPAQADEIPALITLYSKMGEVAPLEIEGAWEKVYGTLKTANSVDVDDPASIQTAADAAYGATQSADDVVAWAQSNCAITLAPVGIIAGGAVVETTTTSPTTTSG